MQGGQTLFGDVRVTAEGSNAHRSAGGHSHSATKPSEGEVGRQTVSSRGRYRFTNLKTGDYEIAIEVDNKEIGRLQQVAVGGLSNSPYGYQYDLDFKLKGAAVTRGGVISAADVYNRTPAAQKRFLQSRRCSRKTRNTIRLQRC